MEGAERPEILLVQLFRRNGYVRLPDLYKRKQMTSQRYKKGYEVRLMVKDQNELKQIRQWLIAAGFKPGKPFEKGKQLIQPIYGKLALERFLTLNQQYGDKPQAKYRRILQRLLKARTSRSKRKA